MSTLNPLTWFKKEKEGLQKERPMTGREFESRRIKRRFSIAEKAIINELIFIENALEIMSNGNKEWLAATSRESRVRAAKQSEIKLKALFERNKRAERKLYSRINELIEHARFIASKVPGKKDRMMETINDIEYYNKNMSKTLEDAKLHSYGDVGTSYTEGNGMRHILGSLGLLLHNLQKEIKKLEHEEYAILF